MLKRSEVVLFFQLASELESDPRDNGDSNASKTLNNCGALDMKIDGFALDEKSSFKNYH